MKPIIFIQSETKAAIFADRSPHKPSSCESSSGQPKTTAAQLKFSNTQCTDQFIANAFIPKTSKAWKSLHTRHVKNSKDIYLDKDKVKVPQYFFYLEDRRCTPIDLNKSQCLLFCKRKLQIVSGDGSKLVRTNLNVLLKILHFTNVTITKT